MNLLLKIKHPDAMKGNNTNIYIKKTQMTLLLTIF